MELSALSYFFRVLIEGNQGALPLRPQQGAALHPRRVFDPLDTLHAIALSTLSCSVRVFMQGFASADATKGLSDRPLETFGADTSMFLGFYRCFNIFAFLNVSYKEQKGTLTIQ